MKNKKGFAEKDIAIGIFVLVLIGAIATIVFGKISDSVILARESRYITYVSQMRDLVIKVNTVSAFNKIKSSEWSCLGAYAGAGTDYCWGKEFSVVINDAEIDKAISTLAEIPKGQFSPYLEPYQRGTLIKINPKSIELKVYVGDSERTETVCRQLNMVVDMEDKLSCALSSPIVKN